MKVNDENKSASDVLNLNIVVSSFAIDDSDILNYKEKEYKTDDPKYKFTNRWFATNVYSETT